MINAQLIYACTMVLMALVNKEKIRGTLTHELDYYIYSKSCFQITAPRWNAVKSSTLLFAFQCNPSRIKKMFGA